MTTAEKQGASKADATAGSSGRQPITAARAQPIQVSMPRQGGPAQKLAAALKCKLVQAQAGAHIAGRRAVCCCDLRRGATTVPGLKVALQSVAFLTAKRIALAAALAAQLPMLPWFSVGGRKGVLLRSTTLGSRRRPYHWG